MRAITIMQPGGPDVLAVVDRQSPEPSRGEVRVRVRATAVNRADLLQRMGAYPAPRDAPPDVPGLEYAGEVDALGPGVERLAVGDRVFGLVGGGAYGEQLGTHEGAAGDRPDRARLADRLPAPPDVVLELVGGDYLDEDLRAIAMRGRIVLVGLLAGARAQLDLGLVLRKRARIIGTVLRARPLEEKLAAMRAFEAQVVPLLARGVVKPIVDCVMPLADAARAHARMASNVGFGKIVLSV